MHLTKLLARLDGFDPFDCPACARTVSGLPPGLDSAVQELPPTVSVQSVHGDGNFKLKLASLHGASSAEEKAEDMAEDKDGYSNDYYTKDRASNEFFHSKSTPLTKVRWRAGCIQLKGGCCADTDSP